MYCKYTVYRYIYYLIASKTSFATRDDGNIRFRYWTFWRRRRREKKDTPQPVKRSPRVYAACVHIAWIVSIGHLERNID